MVTHTNEFYGSCDLHSPHPEPPFVCSVLELLLVQAWWTLARINQPQHPSELALFSHGRHACCWYMLRLSLSQKGSDQCSSSLHVVYVDTIHSRLFPIYHTIQRHNQDNNMTYLSDNTISNHPSCPYHITCLLCVVSYHRWFCSAG